MLRHCYYTSLTINSLQCGIPVTDRQSLVRGFTWTVWIQNFPSGMFAIYPEKLRDLFLFYSLMCHHAVFVYCLRTLTIIRCMSAFCISWFLALKSHLHIIHSFCIAKLLILNIGHFEILWIFGLLAVACTQKPNFIVVIFSRLT